MIVTNIGYLKQKDLEEIKHFSIYETHKKTHILIKKTSPEKTCKNTITLYRPIKDRLPYKILEGKSICTGRKVFDSKEDDIKDIDYSKWNNGEQIMAYEELYWAW